MEQEIKQQEIAARIAETNIKESVHLLDGAIHFPDSLSQLSGLLMNRNAAIDQQVQRLLFVSNT